MKRKPGFYYFLGKHIFRGLLYSAGIIGIYFLFKYHVPFDWEAWLSPFTSRPFLMYLVFFVSETFFGIFPPEFFIIWASSITEKVFIFGLLVFILSVISFTGASIAFWAGKMIHRSAFYARLATGRWRKYLRIYRRWGGVVIVISALTPLPFATIGLISAAFGFPYKRYFWFASTRFLRFLIYGILFWQI